MKAVRQISRQHSTSDKDERSDQTDAIYSNLKNKTGSRKSSTDSESPDTTVSDFVNPLYRDKSLKDRNPENKENYDSLKFPRTESGNGQPPPRPTKRQPSPRTDIKKPPEEEIEMGVSNYGYDTEKARPQSWDKSLSTFSPYAVDTPISGPVDERVNSLSVKRDSISKDSDYSFIGEENAYAGVQNPDYDTIPGQKQGHLPPPRQGKRKANLAYETAVIKHEVKTVKTDPEEGYAADEGSSCCHVIFTILVGVLAVIALLMVFLLIFGVISAKKCKECNLAEGKILLILSYSKDVMYREIDC